MIPEPIIPDIEPEDYRDHPEHRLHEAEGTRFPRATRVHEPVVPDGGEVGGEVCERCGLVAWARVHWPAEPFDELGPLR